MYCDINKAKTSCVKNRCFFSFIDMQYRKRHCRN